MAPVIPFIPLIAAGLTAGGGIAATAIGAKASQKAAASAGSTAPVSVLQDDSANNKIGVLPANNTSPLGDESTPSLNRNKLLGN